MKLKSRLFMLAVLMIAFTGASQTTEDPGQDRLDQLLQINVVDQDAIQFLVIETQEGFFPAAIVKDADCKYLVVGSQSLPDTEVDMYLIGHIRYPEKTRDVDLTMRE